MWRPSQLGDVIAERTVETDGSRVSFRIGRPVQGPTTDDPWWCPAEVTDDGGPKLLSVAGEDALQALLLALILVDAELRRRADGTGDAFHWLSSECAPVFADWGASQRLSSSLEKMSTEARKAAELLEQENPPQEARHRVAERLRRLVETYGVSAAEEREK